MRPKLQHWLHLCDFSPLCVFQMKLVITKQAVSRSIPKSVWDQNCNRVYADVYDVTFLHRVYEEAKTVCVYMRRQSHTGYVCVTFLHCVCFQMQLVILPNKPSV